MEFMRIIVFALVAIAWLSGEQAMSADGLITLRSSFGPGETMSRFEAEVRARSMTVFAHVDHAAGAAAVGLLLRPTLPVAPHSRSTGHSILRPAAKSLVSISRSTPAAAR